MTTSEIGFQSFIPLEEALGREWLDANGLGGWASSTVTGTNTRRYHGLLVASLRPPVERYLLWSRCEEDVECGGERFSLSTNLYPNAVHPLGYERQISFSLLPWPCSLYRAGEAAIRKHVFVQGGRNATCAIYENAGDARCVLRVRPLMAFRDYHSLAQRNGDVSFRVDGAGGHLSVQPYPGLPRLHFHHNAPLVEPSPLWYRDFEYPAERARGLDYREDLFSSFVLQWELSPGDRAYLGAAVDEARLDVEQVEASERERRHLPVRYPDPRVNVLARTAKSFVVERAPQGKTILAGYHWFTDWGRDTMISLPGLALLEGETETARQALLAFAAYLDGGMIPNRFPDRGEQPEYNTVDAALWFVHAASRYFRRSGDRRTLRETLMPAVEAVIAGYAAGTRYGIRVEEDGLVSAGEPGTQLTWMDAKVGDLVVTPRQGKPVEINALWYNALRCAAELSRALRRPSGTYTRMAEKARRSFNSQFWNAGAGALYDVLAPSGPDDRVRPNQLFALSLRADLLPPERAAAVLETVTAQLLTPYGLRSLAPSHPQYHPCYSGGVWERDTAYHQGTVWPWLIGAYADAVVNVRGLTDTTREELRGVLDPLLGHLSEAGLGSVSEIFDGDPPHLPRGCISQAWSVAELLRAYHEYLAA